MSEYITINEGSALSRPIKAWTNGVQIEGEAQQQLFNVSQLVDILGPHVAAMPDVHWGMGATVGSVIPLVKAVIPAAVGVDIGCGMLALKLNIKVDDVFDVSGLRHSIERSVPVGFNDFKPERVPLSAEGHWLSLNPRLIAMADKLKNKKDELPSGSRALCQLGTLGGGNHFIELCEDEERNVWIMLHSGSRGIGNKIGQHFIGLAKRDAEKQGLYLPDKDLAYFREGAEFYDDYVEAVQWAQDYALANREIMLGEVMKAVRYHFAKKSIHVEGAEKLIQCHHNYLSKEVHFGQELWITRKGAVRARAGELVIIPGSMGTGSYIARGLGNAESFESCSHGAGRKMSRGKAKKMFTIEDLAQQTAGVECRKDGGVLDEIPGAYKVIEDVMEAQKALVTPLTKLKQFICIKG